MKEVIYSDTVKQDPQDYASVQAATQILDQVATQSANIVTAEWDKATNSHGGPAYVLRLSDWAGSTSKVFGPQDLQPNNFLWSRLSSLWDDLLANRIHRLLDESRELAAQET